MSVSESKCSEGKRFKNCVKSQVIGEVLNVFSLSFIELREKQGKALYRCFVFCFFRRFRVKREFPIVDRLAWYFFVLCVALSNLAKLKFLVKHGSSLVYGFHLVDWSGLSDGAKVLSNCFFHSRFFICILNFWKWKQFRLPCSFFCATISSQSKNFRNHHGWCYYKFKFSCQ